MKIPILQKSLGAAAALVAAVGLFGETANAAVVVSAWYRGGEADTGATIGSPIIGAGGSSPGAMKDSSGNGFNLNPSNNGAAAGPYWASPETAAPGSTVAYGFDPAAANHGVLGSPVQTATTNWGIEGWFQASTLSGQGCMLNVGAGNGYAIYRFGSTIAGFVNGGLFGGYTIPSTSNWYYVALVNNGGTGTLYFGDGVSALQTQSGAMTTPAAPTAATTLGTDTGGNYWSGNIDEARVFSFSPGSFSTSDLLYTAVPEPATWALLAGSLTALVIFRRRRQS